MVRRGSRTSGPAVNNTSTSSLSAPSNRWQRSRPHSANSGELKSGGVKSTDSTTSSPTASSLSTSSSPPLSKKLQGSGGKGGRSSSHWRESGGSGRGGGGGGGKSSNSFKDSKFSITNEDFPALPGARGNTQSHGTPNKNGKKGDPRQSNLNPASKLRELATTTDDSGHSSGSRGHSPPLQDTGKFEKKFQKPLHTDTAKRKTASPAKERPPRGSAASKPLRAIQSPLGSNGSTASPNKKSIAANSGNTTAPSFIKLSKLGQKIPERRGQTRQSNHSSSPTGSTNSPTNDEKENVEANRKANQDMLSPNSQAITLNTTITPIPPPTPVGDTTLTKEFLETETRDNVPNEGVSQIAFNWNGEMTNIPPSMITDQFGMAAMLPILVAAKSLKMNPIPAEESKRTQEQQLYSDITALNVGMDLSTLSVPIKTCENTSNKTVWETFSGPFGLEPIPPPSAGLTPNQVPAVYYTARTLRSTIDMCKNVPDKFTVHELFYVFYNMPKEIWQVNAARELMWRGWRYNKRERLWMHKKLGEPDEYGISVTAPQSAFTQPGANPNEVIVGTFEIYDAEKARITSREMCIRRSDFEIPHFELRAPDTYQQILNKVFTKEMLWGGPREDYLKPNPLIGFPGMQPRVPNGANNGNKPSNLTLPSKSAGPSQPQQSQQLPSGTSIRRILSFADSPEPTPMFETPLGSIPPPTTAEDVYRQQMYAMILAKIQMDQQRHTAASTSGQTQSSASSVNNFQK